MKHLILLGLLLAGTAGAQSDKKVYFPPVKTVKVPYTIYLSADGNTKASAGSCTLNHKGIVLANQRLEGKDSFKLSGTFLLNDRVKAVQLRCEIEGYEPIVESVELVNNSIKTEQCFCDRKLYQEPVVDLDRGIAHVRLKIPTFREEKVWLAGKSFVQLTSNRSDIVSSSYTGEPLLPELPMTNFYFALPLDAQVIGVTVKPGQVVGGLNLPLVPLAEEGSPQFAGAIPPRFDDKIYFSGKNEILVERDARFRSVVDREQNLVKVSVPLVDFIAKQSNIRYYDELDVIVNFKSASRCFRAPFRGRDAVDFYRSQQLVGLNQLILNPNDVLDICRSGEPILRLRRDQPQMARASINFAGPNLVIVSPRDFRDAAERLRLHKETLGIRTAVLEWDGGTAADLKEKLEAAAQGLRPNYMQWVLLLGDVDRIPTYYDAAPGDPMLGDYALSAGDVYYTQFPDQPEAYTPSLDPKFSIGRIPVKSLDELQKVMDRTINYENNPPTVDYYYQSPTIAATLQMTNSPDTGSVNNYAEFMENRISKRYFNAGFRPERIFRTDTEKPLKPVNWSPAKPIDYAALTVTSPELYPQLLFHMEGSQDLIDNAVKRGTSILINRGHATTRQWAWPGFSY
ncbi:MAG: C25 family cysteine peptidase, partial [Pseudobdellovibrionaceae bacterium]|nr:C25 family cysteine peptidase [Pseudobdellovibrionaceae bacterium]